MTETGENAYAVPVPDAIPAEAFIAARERVEENDAVWRVAAGDTEIAVNARQAIMMSALDAAALAIRAAERERIGAKGASPLAGRCAYEAFATATRRSLNLPAWKDIPPGVRAEWQMTADAVLMFATLEGHMTGLGYSGWVPSEADRERLGAELAGQFSEWASREGLLARVTEEQCADLAKAYLAGALGQRGRAVVLAWRDERGAEILRTPPLGPGACRIAIPLDAQHVDLLTGEGP